MSSSMNCLIRKYFAMGKHQLKPKARVRLTNVLIASMPSHNLPSHIGIFWRTFESDGSSSSIAWTLKYFASGNGKYDSGSLISCLFPIRKIEVPVVGGSGGAHPSLGKDVKPRALL